MSKPQRRNSLEMLKANSNQDISASVKEMSSSKQKLFPDVGTESCSRKTTPSPQPTAKHRRSRDSLLTSSQESLSGNMSGREGNWSSSAEKEDSECVPEKLPPAPDTIEEDEEEENNPATALSLPGLVPGTPPAEAPVSSPVLSDSPDPVDSSQLFSMASSETPTSADVSLEALDASPDHRPDSAPPDPDRERHQTREKSFERSLDNIMDKCSEKSLDLSLTVDSLNGTSISDGNGLPRVNDLCSSAHSASSKCSRNEKKKKSAWYTMLNPTYKSRSEDFKKLFKDIPNDERLIVDYSCALQKDILVQGRMYITQNWVCFYASIFRWETVLAIPCKEITAVTKERTARVIPNAIQVATEKEKYFFTSFGARDKTFMMVFRIWQNALLHEPMSPKELWQWIHYSYGEELGLTSEDEDYVPPPGMEDLHQRLQGDDLLPKGSEDLDLLDDEGDEEDENGDEMEDEMEEKTDDGTFEMSLSEDLYRTPSMIESSVSLTRDELPTDLSDTTEESEGEVICTGHDHLEKLYLDEVFNMSIENMFQQLFTNSPCLRNFVSSRKTFDLHFPPWGEEMDENGNRVRNCTYTLTLNHAIGPKTSPSTEKQILHKESQPNLFYVVDAECCNNGIPYADAFFVMNRYCLTRVSKNTCRLRVTTELRYRKSVMGIVRNMIEKSVVSGVTDYFRSLSAHLRKECERMETPILPIQQSSSKKKLRRRRKVNMGGDGTKPTGHHQKDLRKSAASQQGSTPPSPSRAGQSHKDEAGVRLQADVLIRIICFVLILLVMFNAVLFYKLWSLESYAHALYFPHSDAIINDFGKQPRSQEEWMQLLQQQRLLYENEMEKWHDILSASVKLVDQMRETLLQLLTGLEQKSSMSSRGFGHVDPHKS